MRSAWQLQIDFPFGELLWTLTQKPKLLALSAGSLAAVQVISRDERMKTLAAQGPDRGLAYDTSQRQNAYNLLSPYENGC